MSKNLNETIPMQYLSFGLSHHFEDYNKSSKSHNVRPLLIIVQHFYFPT